MPPDYLTRWTTEVSIGTELDGEAPHGLTARAQYTVPTFYNAVITGQFLKVTRITVATTSGRATASIAYPTTGPALMAKLFSNAIGATDGIANSPFHCLAGSEGVILYTQDGSIGGTVDYAGFIAIREMPEPGGE